MGKKKQAEKINLAVAPYNWVRMTAYIEKANAGDRTGPKIKYTDVINLAIKRYFGKNI